MEKTTLIQKIILIGFGIILFVLLFEFGLYSSGQVLLSIQHLKNELTINNIKNLNDTYIILALGESTTAELYNNQSSWPRELETILNLRNTNYSYVVLQEAVPSTNTREILNRLNNNLNKYKPNMVITMMGINDENIILPYKNSKNKIIHAFKSLRTYELITLSIHNIVEEFKKPLTEDAYLELAKESFEKEEYIKAEKNFKNIINQNPKNFQAYIGLGRVFLNNNEYNKAEKLLLYTIKQNSKNNEVYLAYIILGKVYREQKKFDKAEKMFKTAITLNHENDYSYTTLGIFYGDAPTGNYEKAKEMLNKAIELNPSNEDAYLELGVIHSQKEKYDKAEKMFKKVIDLNSFNENAHTWLAWIYLIQNKSDKAEKILKEGVISNSNNEMIYGSLGLYYNNLDQYELSKKYFEKANNKRIEFYNILTYKNYIELNTILKKRKIKHVIMQYPVRSIEPLKKIFKDRTDIIFIDNEEVFKNAIKEKGLNKIFVDLFGGDFGHCTLKGNKLIAKNVANVIIKEIQNS